MSGTIQLLHNKEVIRQMRYSCKSEINDFLEKWKKLYGKGFEKITINNIPDPIQEKPTTPQFKKGSIQKTFKNPTFSRNKYNPIGEE